MATTRPFAYNTGSTISATTQIGDLAIGTNDLPVSDGYGGLIWKNGADEDLGYVIGYPQSGNTQPLPDGGFGSVQFWRSDLLTESSFIEIAEYISNFSQNFTSGNQAWEWLYNNGYYSSYQPTTPTPTPAVSPTTTPTPTTTTTLTATPTVTSSRTPTPTTTTTLTATPTQTNTPTVTRTPGNTPTPSPTVTNTPTVTRTPNVTPSVTPTNPGTARVLILGDTGVNTVATNINSYITSTGKSITYSAVTMGTTYTGSGNITKANYDVVLIYTNGGQIGTTTMANALTTFVGQGGSIVSGTFLFNVFPTGYNFTGTTAFNTNSQSNPPGGNIIITSATTITNGIGLSMPTFFNNGAITLNSGAIQLATYSNGDNLLAVKTIGSSTLVSINAAPLNINSSTSTITKMFGNAILYAAGKI